MQITKIETQKRSNRFNVYVDEVFFCGVSDLTLGQFGFYKGREVTEKELEDIAAQEIYNRFYDRAINYLARAIKSEKQLRQYLKELAFKKKGKWFNEEIDIKLEEMTESIVEKLRKMGVLDDQNYAMHFIEARVRNKPRSLNMIKFELMQKGVDQEIIDGLIADNSSTGSVQAEEKDLLKAVYSKKFGETKLKIDDSKKIRYLQSKGFRWDDIKKLIENKDDIRE